MKKNIVIFGLSIVLISGQYICTPVYSASASQTEKNMEAGEMSEVIKGNSEESGFAEEIDENQEENRSVKENNDDSVEKNLDYDEVLQESKGINEEKQSLETKVRENKACLQVPQKLRLTLDPFEINGKGQIYSDQYIIKNAGETGGVLSLSELICEAGEDSGVVIKTDKEGLHEADEKFVYIKIVFENDEAIVLSPEGNTYEIWLDAGEELTFWYSGEINENAAQNWEEHDITVGMVYSWDMKKAEE